jgi:hypothetical protein
VDFQNSHALGFRRVRRDGGLNINGVQGLLNVFRRDAKGRNLGEGMGQRTRYDIGATLLFIFAAVADGGIFFRDVEELQPDTNRLQGVLDQMRGNAGGLLRLVNDAQNGGFAQADDLAEEVAQHDGDFVNIGAFFGS